MKSLAELINRDDPGWPIVQQWIAEAKNHVEVLPALDDERREQALVAAQVTTRSPMGAIIYKTGGILVDHGWMRILGSGHPRFPRSLADWNFKRSVSVSGTPPPFILVADDVIGGLYAIDGGSLGAARGKICYFAPEILKWEATELGYSDFVQWCMNGDLQKYYEMFRWPGWEKDVAEIRGDQGFCFEPDLSRDDMPVVHRKRRVCTMAELYALHLNQPDN